jgi:hypothetical protein
MSQNCINEEIRSQLKSGNACCHSMRIFCLLVFYPKNVEINIYGTIILPVVLYGCEIWLQM